MATTDLSALLKLKRQLDDIDELLDCLEQDWQLSPEERIKRRIDLSHDWSELAARIARMPGGETLLH